MGAVTGAQASMLACVLRTRMKVVICHCCSHFVLMQAGMLAL